MKKCIYVICGSCLMFFSSIIVTRAQNQLSKNIASGYDSSYDFKDISTHNINPQELVGQEIVFAQRHSASEVTRPERREDSFFICFSSMNTLRVNQLLGTQTTTNEKINVVDGSRLYHRYKNLTEIKSIATTNAYCAKAMLINEYPFSTDKDETALLIGTDYSSLAGKIFTIKAVVFFSNYYPGSGAYLFTLRDADNNEVTFFYFFSYFLPQMIHIKGYMEKQHLRDDYIGRAEKKDAIANIPIATLKNKIPLYDSSYDFNDIDAHQYNLNPKELIGQEIIFDELNEHYLQDTLSAAYRQLEDTIFRDFSSSVVTPLDNLTGGMQKDTMKFNLIDGSRNCQRQKDGLLLIANNPTTNTYKPESVITKEGIYPVPTYKSNIFIGTNYRSLAGKTFTIKNVTTIFDYYDSRDLAIYTLLDKENNEITFISNVTVLPQTMHIKGYLKKIELHNTGKKFNLKFQVWPNDNWTPPVEDSILIDGAYLIHSDGTFSYYRKEIASRDQLQFIGIRNINIDNWRIQCLTFEFLTKDKEKICIPYINALMYLPPSFSSRKYN